MSEIINNLRIIKLTASTFWNLLFLIVHIIYWCIYINDIIPFWDYTKVVIPIVVIIMRYLHEHSNKNNQWKYFIREKCIHTCKHSQYNINAILLYTTFLSTLIFKRCIVDFDFPIIWSLNLPGVKVTMINKVVLSEWGVAIAPRRRWLLRLVQIELARARNLW